jgi:NADH dehydrogenase
MPHVVIIGGGFGGLEAAREYRGAPVRVTLLDRHNYHLFQPLLYQVATAALSPGAVASPIRWVLRKEKNVQVLLAEARRIDPASRRVFIDPGPPSSAPGPALSEPGGGTRVEGPALSEPGGGTRVEGPALSEPGGGARVEGPSIAYDYLIVAAGGAHAYFGHTDWEAHAPGLKTLDDALEIRRQVLLSFEAAEREQDPEARRRLLTFVIVGGGPTGVELAGALAEMARQSLPQDFRSIRPESARIVLVEGSPHVLGMYPDRLRDASRRALERLGVDVRTDAKVTGVDVRGVSIGSERIEAQTILWAAGIAASPLARSLGVPLDRVGRVTPEPTLAVPGQPRIFVAGDICALTQDGVPLPGVAQVAMQQGRHAAANTLRAIAGQPLTPFRYINYGNMATIGRGFAVADIGGVKTSGYLAWLFWLFLHLFRLIGFRNRLAVMGEWAWAYVTSQRRVRLITGGKLWPS